MRALILTGVKQPLELMDRTPAELAPGEVIVELRIAALNRRDYWITQGMYPGIEPPVILGSDGAGVVAVCGEGVDSSWIGREVIINPGLNWGSNESAQADSFSILGLPRDGTFATHVSIPATQLHEKPGHLSWEEAAALPLAGVTAHRALFAQGGLRTGESVLITGIGGGVATMALQMAVASGADVWVTSSSLDKIERAKGIGAKGGFLYTENDWTKRFRGDAGAANLIVDSAGGAGYKSLIDVAAPGGRIVNYGATTGPPESIDLFKVFWKQLRLQGSTMGSPSDFTAMMKLVTHHKIRPLIDRVIPLEQGNEAVAMMKSSPQFGKIVLAIS